MTDWFTAPEIRSYSKPATVYCNAGEEIRIIEEQETVMICEKKDGERFPVAREVLKGKVIERPVQTESKKKSKSVPISMQQSIF